MLKAKLFISLGFISARQAAKRQQEQNDGKKTFSDRWTCTDLQDVLRISETSDDQFQGC